MHRAWRLAQVVQGNPDSLNVLRADRPIPQGIGLFFYVAFESGLSCGVGVALIMTTLSLAVEVFAAYTPLKTTS